MDDNIKNLLITAIIGIVAGWLGSLVVGGPGNLFGYLVAGIIGAFVGSYLLKALNINLGIKDALVSQIATSTIGAIVVLLIARLLLGH